MSRGSALVTVGDARAVFEDVAAALESAVLDPLLDGEARLAPLAGLLRTLQLADADPTTLRCELVAARAALDRCRRLGEALDTFAETSRAAVGVPTYGPGAAPDATGFAFTTRV